MNKFEIIALAIGTIESVLRIIPSDKSNTIIKFVSDLLSLIDSYLPNNLKR